jgi:peptidoglycan/xylan/chitin deacetylase (PgdA/CDA1 family)
MYHYVQEYNTDLPYFSFLDFTDFQRQLDYFQGNFGFVTRQEWMQFVSGERIDLSSKVLLTFDDGLQCHYHYVFPELIKRGLWAIFYVSTTPLTKKIILDVHLIHLLLGRFDSSDVLSKLLLLIDDQMITDQKIKEFREDTYSRQNNTDETRLVKRILNYYIDYQYRNKILSDLLVHFNFYPDPNGFYLSGDHLLEMDASGMIIGSHSHSHLLLSKLTKKEQFSEIKESISFFQSSKLKETISTYCHPYGGRHSYNKDTINILDELGIKYSFDVNPRDISILDLLESKQFLPRYDCNQFPFGQIYDYSKR